MVGIIPASQQSKTYMNLIFSYLCFFAMIQIGLYFSQTIYEYVITTHTDIPHRQTDRHRQTDKHTHHTDTETHKRRQTHTETHHTHTHIHITQTQTDIHITQTHHRHRHRH